MPLGEQVDRFDLTIDQARQLRRAALNLAAPPLEPKERWDAPAARSAERTVPDVGGLPLESARSAIEAALLTVGDVTVRDSDRPPQVVLNQYPDAGERAPRRAPVDLVIASGATVRIPDVIGKPVSEALLMLRRAGLASEPRLVFTHGATPHSVVVDVTPRVREFATPRADVVIEVSTASGT
jgi:beta-lactam-binding protein with PASTA domain